MSLTSFSEESHKTNLTKKEISDAYDKAMKVASLKADTQEGYCYKCEELIPLTVTADNLYRDMKICRSCYGE